MRFSAVLTVFLFHFGVMNETNSTPFWRFHLRFYSQTSVTVFFVLSGHVIAYVLATREKTALEYCASSLRFPSRIRGFDSLRPLQPLIVRRFFQRHIMAPEPLDMRHHLSLEPGVQRNATMHAMLQEELAVAS